MKPFTAAILFLAVSIAGCSCNADKHKADRAFRRGYDAHRQKDFDRAIAAYSEAIEHDPANASAYFNRGLVYSEMGRHDDAIRDYTESISRDGSRADVYFARGRCHALKANPDDDPLAIADFTEANRLNPTHATAYHGRGASKAAVVELEAGIEDLRHSLELDPNQENAQSDLNRLLKAREEIERKRKP